MGPKDGGQRWRPQTAAKDGGQRRRPKTAAKDGGQRRRPKTAEALQSRPGDHGQVDLRAGQSLRELSSTNNGRTSEGYPRLDQC